MADRDVLFTGIKLDFPPMVASGLDSGCGIDETDERGMSPLFLASYMNRGEIVSMLIERGANCEFRFQDMTPVMAATEGGAASALEILLAAGANIDASSCEGLTSLMIAVRDGNAAVAKLLIAYGANLSLRTQSGSTALDVAQSLGASDMVAILAPYYNKDYGGFMGQLARRVCAYREDEPKDE